MPKYLFVYHGGDFPEELARSQGVAWDSWLQSLGPQVLDQGGPLQPGGTLAANGKVVDNGGANPATGYNIIEAASFEAAITIAKGCPQTKAPHENGTIEIAEVMSM